MIEQSQSLQEQFKQITIDGIRYSLNCEDNTASVIENPELIHNIFIPRSFNYESKEYIITRIQNLAFSRCNMKLTLKQICIRFRS